MTLVVLMCRTPPDFMKMRAVRRPVRDAFTGPSAPPDPGWCHNWRTGDPMPLAKLSSAWPHGPGGHNWCHEAARCFKPCHRAAQQQGEGE